MELNKEKVIYNFTTSNNLYTFEGKVTVKTDQLEISGNINKDSKKIGTLAYKTNSKKTTKNIEASEDIDNFINNIISEVKNNVDTQA